MNNTVSSNPWPGLGSYDDSGRYKFCGRGRAANELYSLISENAVISLYGRSGIGKTSLLKAGVTPLLVRRGFIPVYVRLSQEGKTSDDTGRGLLFAECIIRCLELKMKDNGFTTSRADGKAVPPESPDFLWSYFCSTSFQTPDGENCTPVIILDQYEEIFQDRMGDAALLMRQLYALVDDSRRFPQNLDIDDFRSRFRFVMSFRDDSLYRLEDVINDYNLTSFKENRYLLKALSRDDAREVITEPGEGLVDAEVSNLILDKVISMGDGSSVDPAILSLLMYGLYDRMIHIGASSIQATLVNEAGNDIVQNFYEQGMSGIGLSARKYLEEHLVSSDGRRRSVAAADIRQYVSEEVLESLTDGHILTKLERGSFTDYELTHDVLCPIVTASRAQTLAKEKIARSKRMMRVMAAIVTAVLAIVAVFFFQNKSLKEQRWTALGNQSRFIAEKALQLAEEGNPYLAKALLINTMPSNLSKPERPLTVESVLALVKVFDNSRAILKGDMCPVHSAVYSPDGRSILSASGDNTVRIWDSDTGVCLKVWETDDVFSAAYSPDGRSIVSASLDNTIRIWDSNTGECLKVLEGHTDDVNSAAYSPDGRSIVSTSYNTVRIWDSNTGVCLKVLEGHTDYVNSAFYSPDGKSIVSTSIDNTVRIWDSNTGECLKVLEGHTDDVNSAAYSPDGRSIVSASEDNTVRIWDSNTGECLNVLEGHTDYVCSAVYSPDGRSIVSASRDKSIRIWDSNTGECLNVLEGHTEEVFSAAYSPDGRSIVSASLDGTARIWDSADSNCLEVMVRPTGDVLSAAYNPDGRSIVSTSRMAVGILDSNTGECLKVLEGHTGIVYSAAYSPDGRSIVSASEDKTVRIWDSDTGECLNVLEGHTSSVYSAAYSPDGRCIVSTSDDKTVRVWDSNAGECLKILEGHTDYVSSAAYSPDGRNIVSASGDNNVKIWDSHTGECLKVLEGHTSLVCSAVYSPDGKSIVSTSGDNTVRIWDSNTGECLKVLGGHTHIVYSAVYSPDDRSILSASDDNTVRIWDSDTGVCLKVLEGHTGSVYSAAYSPDGRNIVSTSYDNTIRIWNAPPSLDEMFETTRDRFKDRHLTPEERHRYYLD